MKEAIDKQQWIYRIDEATTGFLKLANSEKPLSTNQEPKTNEWSFPQILDHLITINESYFPTFDSLIKGNYRKPSLSKVRFIPKWIGKQILKTVLPEQRKKTKTFQIWEPSSNPDPETILDKFEKHQEQLKNYIIRLEPLTQTNPIIHSPANKLIIYPLNTALDIITTHEHRHLGQAEKLIIHDH